MKPLFFYNKVDVNCIKHGKECFLLHLFTSKHFLLEHYTLYCIEYILSYDESSEQALIVEINTFNSENFEHLSDTLNTSQTSVGLRNVKNIKQPKIGNSFKVKKRDFEPIVYVYKFPSEPHVFGQNIVFFRPNSNHKLLNAKQFYVFSASFDREVLGKF